MEVGLLHKLHLGVVGNLDLLVVAIAIEQVQVLLRHSAGHHRATRHEEEGEALYLVVYSGLHFFMILAFNSWL